MKKAFAKWALLLALLIASGFHLASAQTVYVTNTGKKYHRSSCRYLRLSQNAISLSNAQKRGYDACLVCRPSQIVEKDKSAAEPDSLSSYADSTNVKPIIPAARRTTAAVRCSASTKAGTQCKRMTNNARGRCWQHEN